MHRESTTDLWDRTSDNHSDCIMIWTAYHNLVCCLCDIQKIRRGTLLKGYENFQIRQIARGLEVFLFDKKLHLL